MDFKKVADSFLRAQKEASSEIRKRRLNKSVVAKTLGITRQTLYFKLDKCNWEPEELRALETILKNGQS